MLRAPSPPAAGKARRLDPLIARHGEEARDYFFGFGPHAGREPSECPELVLLNLTLPKINGFVGTTA